MNPEVSVIIPNYNHARFLEGRIESILDQTFTNYEIIILDDASSDESVSVINRYRNHPRVTNIIINSKNSGHPILQWIRGLSVSSGQYLWIAESDDYASPVYLETLLHNIKSNRTCLAYSHSFVVDEENTIIDELTYNHPCFSGKRWKSDYINNGHSEIEKYLVFRNTIPNVSAVLFRKNCIGSAFEESKKFSKSADWSVYIRMLLNGDISFVSEPLNYFREHADSTRNFSEENLYIKAKEHEEILNEIEKHQIVDAKQINELRQLSENKIEYFTKLSSTASAFVNFVSSHERVVMWGYNDLARDFIDRAEKAGFSKNILAVIDNKKGKQGVKYKNIRVLLPEEMNVRPIDFVVTSWQSNDSILKDIHSLDPPNHGRVITLVDLGK
jgi:glycosyltransferase involved in cell wall biosynthesis